MAVIGWVAPIMWPSLDPSLAYWVIVGCFVALVAAGALLYFPAKAKPSVADAPVRGDTYNNSGSNFGHMGPLQVGYQRFEFSKEVAAEVLRSIPREGALNVTIIGSTPHAQRVGNYTMQFLKENGYSIGERRTIGYMSNALQEPIIYNHQARHLIIVPDA